MEHLEGRKLCDIWKGLTLEHKLSIVDQLAQVLGQLAELKFDAIGSLTSEGTLGPLLNMTEETKPLADEPFTSTTDYFFAFLKDDHPERTLAARKHYPAIKTELRSFLHEKPDDATLNHPYRLIHNDLDAQNILVHQNDEAAAPQITGIIDWDWAFIGPLYYLCDYPHDLIDWTDEPEVWADNKVLRKHLVATLIEQFPENSMERKHIKQCFREKCFTLNGFKGTFMSHTWCESPEGELVEQYLKSLRGEGPEWTRRPYDRPWNWERDSDLTDSDQEDTESEDSDETSDEGREDNDEREDGVESNESGNSEEIEMNDVESIDTQPSTRAR